ncbi:MAG: hypothetical protein ACLQLH_05475 [Terracidiphilus sp.]
MSGGRLAAHPAGAELGGFIQLRPASQTPSAKGLQKLGPQLAYFQEQQTLMQGNPKGTVNEPLIPSIILVILYVLEVKQSDLPGKSYQSED